VTVTAQISSAIKVREITVPGENIKDTGGKNGVNYTWDTTPVVVTIMGEIDKISEIEPEDIVLQIDMSPYSESNRGTVRVKAEVIIDSEHKDEIIEIGTYKVSVTFDN